MYNSSCCRYTLLFGKPPFETHTLKDTYHKIRRGDYCLPNTRVSPAARNLITKMLTVDPSLRPTAKQVLNHEFLAAGTIWLLKHLCSLHARLCNCSIPDFN